jgi:hypothetical protein
MGACDLTFEALLLHFMMGYGRDLTFEALLLHFMMGYGRYLTFEALLLHTPHDGLWA